MATLSVIIPCFNGGVYLKKMVDCCLKQTFRDWELIIVDDQSTDGTIEEMVRDYEKIDPRVKFYVRDREPKGSVVCRNIGFEKSTGKYIIHFDADDLLSDTCFEKRVKFMDDNPDCDFASFPAKMFRDENNLPKFEDVGITFGVPRSNDDLSDFLKYEYPYSVWNNIYRREAIENLPWDENVKIYTDFSFILPCIFSGLRHKYSNLREIDYFYRVAYSNTNMCASFISDEKSRSTLYLFNKILKQLESRSDCTQRKQEFFRYVLVQVERLVLNQNKDYIHDFIDLVRMYYKPFAVKRIQWSIAVSNLASSNDGKRLLLYFIYTCLFCYKKMYLRLFARLLRGKLHI